MTQYEVYFVLLWLLFFPVTSYKGYKVTDVLNPYPCFQPIRHSQSHYCSCHDYGRLQQVMVGCNGLQYITGGYNGLQQDTVGYTMGYGRLQYVTS